MGLRDLAGRSHQGHGHVAGRGRRGRRFAHESARRRRRRSANRRRPAAIRRRLRRLPHRSSPVGAVRHLHDRARLPTGPAARREHRRGTVRGRLPGVCGTAPPVQPLLRSRNAGGVHHHGRRLGLGSHRPTRPDHPRRHHRRRARGPGHRGEAQHRSGSRGSGRGHRGRAVAPSGIVGGATPSGCDRPGPARAQRRRGDQAHPALCLRSVVGTAHRPSLPRRPRLPRRGERRHLQRPVDDPVDRPLPPARPARDRVLVGHGSGAGHRRARRSRARRAPGPTRRIVVVGAPRLRGGGDPHGESAVQRPHSVPPPRLSRGHRHGRRGHGPPRGARPHVRSRLVAASHGRRHRRRVRGGHRIVGPRLHQRGLPPRTQPHRGDRVDHRERGPGIDGLALGVGRRPAAAHPGRAGARPHGCRHRTVRQRLPGQGRGPHRRARPGRLCHRVEQPPVRLGQTFPRSLPRHRRLLRRAVRRPARLPRGGQFRERTVPARRHRRRCRFRGDLHGL